MGQKTGTIFRSQNVENFSWFPKASDAALSSYLRVLADGFAATLNSRRCSASVLFTPGSMLSADELLLTTSQKDDIFLVLAEEKLDPTLFSWGQQKFQGGAYSDATYRVSVLALSGDGLKRTGGRQYYFVFDYRNGENHAIYSPSKDGPRATLKTGDWKSQLIFVRVWAQELRRELEAPDLFKQFQSFRNNAAAAATKTETGATLNELLASVAATKDNAPFAASEVAAIQGDLLTMAASIGSRFDALGGKLGDLQAQQEQILESLAYLRESTERLGRKDWLNLGLSTLLQALIPAEKLRGVLGDELNHLLALIRDHAPKLLGS